MNHDELLAKLSNDENGYAGSTPLQRLYALRAVVKLHMPYQDHVIYCQECEVIYPCPTIRAIEQELM